MILFLVFFLLQEHMAFLSYIFLSTITNHMIEINSALF
jgi:hypothetical protein